MSEAQEFGGPINRPAHNARQVTPGEALTNAQPSGAGVDFLGLNQQMQGAPAASAPAPAPAATPEQSWLMEVTESAPRSLAPAAQELAPSPTAASLLNASWREETPEPRRSRWLIPVASGAVLSALGVIGLPLLRRDPAPAPAPSTLTRPTPVASTGPAAPSTLDESALAALNGEPQLEPVAPDAKLDRPERPRPGRGGAQLAQVGGRSEAPVNAPEPGSSFVAPNDVIDPSGVWTVTSGDADSSQDSDGDIDTSETIDGSPEGVTTSAPDSASAASEGVLVGECEPNAPRRAGLPASVEVDWDRLVWIARASEVDASDTASETTSDAPESAVASSPKPNQQDQGIARAVDAWNSAEAEDGQVVAAAPEASEHESDEQPVDESANSPEVITVAEVEPRVEEAPRAVAQTSAEEVAAVESSPVAQPVAAPSEVAIAPVEATPESAPEQDESAVEVLTAPSEEAVASSAPEADASAEPVSAEPGARVKVLARGSGRAIERRLAAERRQARRQKQGAEEAELPLEVETDADASSALASPISPEIPSVDPLELARAAAIEVASTSPESQAPVTQPASPPSEKPAESPAHAESVAVAAVEAPQAPAQPAAESTSTPVAPQASEVAVAPQAPAESEVKVATPASEAPAVSQAAPVAANVPAETEAAARPIEPEPQRVLQVATAADLEKVWSGETIPLEAISGKSTLATPEIGMTRVVFHTGEVFEGELVALGEGRLWLRNSVGRIALDGARVKSAQRIAPGAALSSQAAQAKKLAGLPRARVKTPGGVLHGRVLERNERVTTIIIPSGARVVLDSRTVEVLEDVPLVQIRP